MEDFRTRQKKSTILASLIANEKIKDLSRAAKFVPAVTDDQNEYNLELQDMYFIDFSKNG